MTRLAAFAAAFLMATPVAAQDKEAMCDKTAAIVGKAVASRADGAAAEATVKAVTGSIDDADARYRPAVQPIVDWVYTLPEELLSDEVEVSYKEQCLAQ
ncbi:DNA primase [Roseovarius pacificus]|uniref:DNA primase n=1 Tax=Roseovarius pacificus TaxID=337701 RepID=UPI00403974E6